METVKNFSGKGNIKNHGSIPGTLRGNFVKIILLITIVFSMALLSSCFVPYYGDDGPYEYYQHHGYRHYEGRGGERHEGGGREHHENGGGERHEGGEGEHHNGGGGEHHEGGEHHDGH